MRITALLGAGTTVEIGGLDTKTLTEHILEKDKLSQQIFDSLKNNGNSSINFEDIMNALEILHSMCIAGKEKFKSHWAAFVNLKDEFKDVSPESLMNAHLELLKNIAEEIYSYDKNFSRKTSNKFFSNFWQKATAKCAWDIVTLNYDTCIEQSLKDNFVDGFADYEKLFGLSEDLQPILAARFNPVKLKNTSKTRLMHLHGCIYFAKNLPPKDVNRDVFKESELDMKKYISYKQAKSQWKKWDSITVKNQAGEIVFNDPIIVGLKKPDKVLNSYPYAYYLYELQKALLDNHSLLVAGLSHNDLYLKNLLIRMAEFHKLKRKIVIITYYDKNKTLTSETYRTVPLEKAAIISENEFEAFSKYLQEEYAEIINFKNRNFHKKGMLESDDGCVRIYCTGFKDAVKNYGDDIINFLSS